MRTQEKYIWLGQIIDLGEAPELAPPSDILMEDVGWWVSLGPPPPVTIKGPPLLPYRGEAMEVEDAGAALEQEEKTTVG